MGHALLASLLYQKVATSTGAGEADSQVCSLYLAVLLGGSKELICVIEKALMRP